VKILRRTNTSRLAAKYILLPIAVTCALWLLRVRDDISLVQISFATVLFAIAWVSYCDWRADKTRPTIPVYGMIVFAYWVFYAVPLFWQDLDKAPVGFRPRNLPEAAIDKAILLVLFGMCCLWLGMRSKIGSRRLPSKVLDVRPNSRANWRYVQVLVAAGIVLAFIPGSANYVLGEGGRQVIILFVNVVPLVAFILVLRRILAGKPQHGDKVLAILFIAVRVLTGVSSGWLGATATMGIVCAAVYAQQRRKVPMSVGLLIVAYVFFFQPGKEAFRKNFWYGGGQATTSDRVTFWFNESMHEWHEALTDDTGEAWKQLASRTLLRASLLGQSANVLDMTPSIVPYQHGRLYSYMAVTLVPRFLWPGKPSVNEANQFYQVAYGITRPQELEKVSVAVGALTESYISFGWLGVPLIMIPLGVFFDFFQSTFLFEESGYLFNAIGLALIPNFLTIEAQFAQYLGGILQMILLVLLVMMPVVSLKRRELPAGFPARRGLPERLAAQRVSGLRILGSR
jgi:O-antigen polysaccharide polymerase Wzy